VSLGLPPDLPLADFDALIDGIANCATLHRAVVAGGNITSSPGRLFIDITALGSVKARKILRRAGARAGDEVYVTGQLGGAAPGWRCARRATATPWIRPAPRRWRASVIPCRRSPSAASSAATGRPRPAWISATASSTGCRSCPKRRASAST
jgi:thiamine-monophosphate kinase